MIDLDKNILETDVLVIGGGIAGLMAAISAAGQGARVLVAEKANTRRSGCGATGNDHFLCYCPPVHGDDMAPILEEVERSQIAGFHDPSLTRLFLEQSFERVRNWNDWGIDMRPHGQWEFSGHAFPDRPRVWLKYAGHNQKPVLTRRAKEVGVQIVNHLPVVDLLIEEGRVIGALGLSVRLEQPLLTVIRAKSAIIATGSGNRLYPAPASPGWMFNIAQCPSCTGSTQALVYRAGGKLVNMEFPARHAGPKFFNRCGKATWIGMIKDPRGRKVGPFVERATREVGDITADVWNSVFTDMLRDGTGPSYMDCTETSEEDLDYMLWGLKNEGNTGMLQYMAAEGIDFRKHMVEFMQYEPFLVGRGVEIDKTAASSLPGLFAAGDPVGNFRADIAGAATFGWIAGQSAAAFAVDAGAFVNAEKHSAVEERMDLFSGWMNRQNGPDWKEANLAVQQIMNDYAGVDVRSETLLKAGLKYLGDLKTKTMENLSTPNAHALMRAAEVLDLFECGEVIFRAALERKETRAMHRRKDFPFTNPLLADKFLTIAKVAGKPVLEWRAKW
jgi:succinate dehydrogenase/fumarate reductase flavoprotein subunit